MNTSEASARSNNDNAGFDAPEASSHPSYPEGENDVGKRNGKENSSTLNDQKIKSVVTGTLSSKLDSLSSDGANDASALRVQAQIGEGVCEYLLSESSSLEDGKTQKVSGIHCGELKGTEENSDIRSIPSPPANEGGQRHRPLPDYLMCEEEREPSEHDDRSFSENGDPIQSYYHRISNGGKSDIETTVVLPNHERARQYSFPNIPTDEDYRQSSLKEVKITTSNISIQRNKDVSLSPDTNRFGHMYTVGFCADSTNDVTENKSLAIGKFFIMLKTKQQIGDFQWKKLHQCLNNLPETVIKHELEKRRGEQEEVLLHVVCARRDATSDTVQRLLVASPETAQYSTRDGMLPLHVACRYKASPEVIALLHKFYPDAIAVVDILGRVPLHHAFCGYTFDLESQKLTSSISDRMGKRKKFSSVSTTAFSHSKTFRKSIQALMGEASPRIVSIIASKDILLLRDGDGKTPMGTFARSCQHIRPSDKKGKKKARHILHIMLNFSPSPSHDLIVSLQTLPEDLLRDALAHVHIKRILNEKTESPCFATAVIMDLVIQILLISAFSFFFATDTTKRITNDETQEDRIRPDVIVHLTFLVAGNFYLIVREILEICSYVRLGRFREWATSGWNWLDVTNIFLVVSSTILMTTRPDELTKYQDLLMVTGGLQWLSILSVLRSTYLPFSVFVSGALHIFRTTIPFLITTAILLGSFSFMYFAGNFNSEHCQEYRQNVKEGESDGYWHVVDITFCDLTHSFLWTYTLLVGTMAEEHFTYSPTSMVLSIIFGFLVIILQLNVLIAIVTDSYNEVKDKGEEVFWAQRFAYLAEVDSIDRLCDSDIRKSCDKKYLEFEKKLRKLWEESIWVLIGTSECSRWKKNLLRVCVLILLPIWLIVGLLTLGWIWPPQVRKWLFCPSVLPPSEDAAAADPQKEIFKFSDKFDLIEDVSLKPEIDSIAAKVEKLETKVELIHDTVKTKMGLMEKKINYISTRNDAIHDMLEEILSRQ